MMLQILSTVYYLTVLLFGLSQAACPSAIFTRNQANPGRPSQPARLFDRCCVGTSSSCSCASGLECCPNIAGQRICIAQPCNPNPCGKGVCVVDGTGSPLCLCQAGLIQNAEGRCVDDPCHPNPCGQGPCTSSTGPNGVTFDCQCSNSFVFNGKTCVHKSRLSDPCAGRDCGSGRCTVTSGRASCICNSGSVLSGSKCITQSAPVPSPPVRAPATTTTTTTTRSTPTSTDLCSRVNCGSGRCEIVNNRATCVCGRTLFFNGRECVPLRTVPRTTTTTTSSPTRGNPPPPQPTQPTQSPSGVTSKTNLSAGDSCDASRTPSTSEIGDSGNQIIRQGTASGCIRSRNYPQPYSNNLFDEVRIPTQGFKTLKITLQDLQMENNRPFTRNNCDTDFFFASGQLFCGSSSSPQVFDIPVNGRSEVVVGLVTDGSNAAKGFLARWDLV